MEDLSREAHSVVLNIHRFPGVELEIPIEVVPCSQYHVLALLLVMSVAVGNAINVELHGGDEGNPEHVLQLLAFRQARSTAFSDLVPSELLCDSNALSAFLRTELPVLTP